jgi:threonylcarbamoyladenosine tRNA methylthiotransferase MtaB
MTYKIYTFGCKVNAYESQALKERLEKEGHTPAKGEEADIYFVNTCAVTNEAER